MRSATLRPPNQRGHSPSTRAIPSCIEQTAPLDRGMAVSSPMQRASFGRSIISRRTIRSPGIGSFASIRCGSTGTASCTVRRPEARPSRPRHNRGATSSSQESPVFFSTSHYSTVVAQIYIVRSLTGIARGDALCQEEGLSSARTAARVTQRARERESLNKWGSEEYDTARTANADSRQGTRSPSNRSCRDNGHH
jgi:hypothetical protein